VRKLLASVVLVLVGCGGGGTGGAGSSDSGAPAAGAANAAPGLASTAVPVQMVFEGLIAFEQVDKNYPEKGMYALMVNASKADPGANRPPCSKANVDYPDHETGIYVEGATMTLSIDGGQPSSAGPLVMIEDEDITYKVDPTSPYVTTPASLAKLVDEIELYWASGNAANGKILVDHGKYTGSDAIKSPYLAGRVFLNSGVVAARANVCAEQPDEFVLYAFKEIGQPDATYCRPPDKVKEKCIKDDCRNNNDEYNVVSKVKAPVELGEDVLVTHAVANTVTLTLINANGRKRELVLTPVNNAKQIRINFRNVKRHYIDQPGDICKPAHLESYQWYYYLTADPAKSACTWIPCLYPSMAGGGKCPNPGPGG